MGKGISKLYRDVSIIGVGCTPFGNVLETPEMKDMTERELFAWACLEAMEDAGVEAKDIDSFYIASVMGETTSRQVGSYGMVADWIGMRNKPGFAHETCCSSTNSGLRHAVIDIASGASDIVLSGGFQMTKSRPIEGKPAGLREPIPTHEISYLASMHTLDQAYWYYGGTSAAVIGDLCATAYAKKYKVPMSQVEEAMNIASIINRKNAVINPLATMAQIDFDQEAKMKGFDSAKDYMKSDFNLRVGLILRLFHGALVVDGASALIVCPTEMAKKFTNHPIDVLGFGSAAEITYHEADAVWDLEKVCFDQAYDMAGITPSEVDYMYVHDCFVTMHLTSTEAGGYFKHGEAWRAILEGRTEISGDRPLSTTGGRTSMGHAFAATGGAEITEAVRQMRGQCGVRQVHPIPEVSVVHNMGGGMHCNVVVLRTHS